MRGFMTERGRAAARRFGAWLAETAAADPAEREERLVHWTRAPAARESHPREEHLLPLMVAASAFCISSRNYPAANTLSSWKPHAFPTCFVPTIFTTF